MTSSEAKEIAEELLAIQQGSVEDAAILAEDLEFVDFELYEEVLEELESREASYSPRTQPIREAEEEARGEEGWD